MDTPLTIQVFDTPQGSPTRSTQLNPTSPVGATVGSPRAVHYAGGRGRFQRPGAPAIAANETRVPVVSAPTFDNPPAATTQTRGQRLYNWCSWYRFTGCLSVAAGGIGVVLTVVASERRRDRDELVAARNTLIAGLVVSIAAIAVPLLWYGYNQCCRKAPPAQPSVSPQSQNRYVATSPPTTPARSLVPPLQVVTVPRSPELGSLPPPLEKPNDPPPTLQVRPSPPRPRVSTGSIMRPAKPVALTLRVGGRPTTRLPGVEGEIPGTVPLDG